MQIMNELFMTYFLSKNKLITYIYKDTLKDLL